MSFVALKLTGSYIDFMLALGPVLFEMTMFDPFIWYTSWDNTTWKIISIKVNSDNEGLKSSASTTLKELFGEKMVQSFSFRTCVEPDVIQDDQNQISKIRYSSQGSTKLLDLGHSVRRPVRSG